MTLTPQDLIAHAVARGEITMPNPPHPRHPKAPNPDHRLTPEERLEHRRRTNREYMRRKRAGTRKTTWRVDVHRRQFDSDREYNRVYVREWRKLKGHQ